MIYLKEIKITKQEKQEQLENNNWASSPITKKEILDRLDYIKDTMDTDFLNRYTIEGLVEDITELQLKINIGMKIEVD